jgi:hypothetical protein
MAGQLMFESPISPSGTLPAAGMTTVISSAFGMTGGGAAILKMSRLCLYRQVQWEFYQAPLARRLGGSPDGRLAETKRIEEGYR